MNNYFKKIAGITLLFLLGYNISSIAQSTVTVGNGTSTSSAYPITGCYGYTYSQQIYLQSEIVAANGFGGTIDKIRFYYSSGAYANSTDWTVFIGNTTKSSFANANDWVPVSSLTQVFSGTVSYPASGNWLEITLSTPFNYNGVDNLIIAVDENQSGYSCSANWRITSSSNTRSIRYYNDATNPDPANPPVGTFNNSSANSYANLQLDITPFQPCTGTPTAGNTTASSSNVCLGLTADLGIQNNFNTVSQIAYQWQYNDATLGWTSLTNDTNSTYTSSPVLSSISYRCIVTCLNSGSSDTSQPITINPIIPDSVNVTPDSYALCSGASVNLTATTNGASTFSWSPSNGVSSTSGSNVSANPTQATTYTVQATDANNCITQATAFVTPIEDVSAFAQSNPLEICNAGSPVSIELINYPMALSGAGSWEFQWYDTAGNIVNPWSVFGNTHLFNPSSDGLYNFTVDMRSTACPTDSISNAANAQIVVGFGADVDTTQVNCINTLGSFELINTFGQSAIDTALQLNFSSGANSNVTLFGDAIYDGNMIACTPSATGASGGFTFAQPTVPSSNNAFSIQFNLTVDQPINNYGTGGADGVCYSFGDDINTSSYNHNGTGSKLRLCFDAANNSSTNGNVVGIYLVYGWNSTTAFGPNSTEVLAYSSNASLWKGNADVPVKLTVTEDGKATVNVGATAVFSNIQLPTSYLNEDLTTWTHAFTAATGGDAERHGISNITLTSSALAYGLVAGASNTNPPTAWQSSSKFTGLTPGFYHLWMSNPSNNSCNKDLGVFEIKNSYPVVSLGNDTVLCMGDSLILDAGNNMNAYLWNKNNWTLQTLTVKDEGTYTVSVTDSVGCSAMASVDVEFADVPSADDLFISGNGYNYTFFVVNPHQVGSFDWFYGDNNQLLGGNSSTSHTYGDTGAYEVKVYLNSQYGCGLDSITQTIQVTYPLGLNAINEETIQVYPNPANSEVTFDFKGLNLESIQVYSLSNQLMANESVNKMSQVKLDVSTWTSGIYLVKLTNVSGELKTIRIAVSH